MRLVAVIIQLKVLFSSKEVLRQNYKMHYNYCCKNITKCPHCQEPVNIKEVQDHIDKEIGTPQEIQEAALNARFKRLKMMV